MARLPLPRGDHSSRPHVTVRLKRRYPGDKGRAAPTASEDAILPVRSCSEWGLPCKPRYRSPGALLPHPFTLTHNPKVTGGLLSVALSLRSPSPGVTRHPALRSSDFPPPAQNRRRSPSQLWRHHAPLSSRKATLLSTPRSAPLLALRPRPAETPVSGYFLNTYTGNNTPIAATVGHVGLRFHPPAPP